MKRTFTITVALFVALAGFFALKGKASADDGCVMVTSADLAQLQAIQNDPTLTPGQELSQELALRRQLLSQTIACATGDAQALRATLTAAGTIGSTSAVAGQLSGRIDDTVNFYTIESAKLDGAGIAATEAIAKEIAAWRSANYVPLEGDVNNFVLWEKNQALFQTAEQRLTQTQRIVTFIENAATTNGDLQSALGAVQTSFALAQSQNVAAGLAIGQIQAPDQALGLIQASLQSLADTYQKFSDLNAQIQTLLPTSN